jgi:hypothetical protein
MKINMWFLQHITYSILHQTSGPVFVVTNYLDPPHYFQTGLQGEITNFSRKTTCPISWPICYWSFINNCISCMMAILHISVSLPIGTWIKSFLVNTGTVRVGPIAWPSHSYDLNPLDFYLWGHLKSMYSSPVDDVETLWNQMWHVFRQYAPCQKLGIDTCIQAGGGHTNIFCMVMS